MLLAERVGSPSAVHMSVTAEGPGGPISMVGSGHWTISAPAAAAASVDEPVVAATVNPATNATIRARWRRRTALSERASNRRLPRALRPLITCFLLMLDLRSLGASLARRVSGRAV
jgi:hypothetical protein